jgi:hypothetical protein
MSHRHTPEEEQRIREAALDETLAETFPASDAPSTLPDPDDDALLRDEQDSGPSSGPSRVDHNKP